MSQSKKKRMGELLMAEGLITQDQLMTALEYQKSNGMPFGQIVVKLGFMMPMDLTNFLAKQYSLPITDLTSMVIPINLVKTLPWALIKRLKVIPIHQDGMTLTVCTADPSDFNAIEELQYATGKQIDMNLAPLSDIVRVIEQIESRSKKKATPSSPALTSSAVKTSGEDVITEDIRTRSNGKLKPHNMNKADLREALIPVLLKKGVISRAELYDAVADLLVRKGVVESKDVEAFMRTQK